VAQSITGATCYRETGNQKTFCGNACGESDPKGQKSDDEYESKTKAIYSLDSNHKCGCGGSYSQITSDPYCY
jgi:hypothetical protein